MGSWGEGERNGRNKVKKNIIENIIIEIIKPKILQDVKNPCHKSGKYFPNL